MEIPGVQLGETTAEHFEKKGEENPQKRIELNYCHSFMGGGRGEVKGVKRDFFLDVTEEEFPALSAQIGGRVIIPGHGFAAAAVEWLRLIRERERLTDSPDQTGPSSQPTTDP